MNKKISIKLNHHLFFHSNSKLLPGHRLDHLSKLKPFTKTYLWNIDINISVGGQIKETKKSTRRRTRVTGVNGKPNTINSKRRRDRSPTRRRRKSKTCNWRNGDSLRSKTKPIYHQHSHYHDQELPIPQPRNKYTPITLVNCLLLIYLGFIALD